MFLTIKKIPKTNWSSPKPLNFKPKISTFYYLCLGLSFFGLGEGLLLVSSTGASPWSVLAQGISLNIDYSIGIITFFISLFVIFLWIFTVEDFGILVLPPRLSYSIKPIFMSQAGRSFLVWGIIKGTGLVMEGAIR